MRTFEEIESSATDQSPFSNGTEGYAWMGNWCDRCHQPDEKAWRRYEEGKRKTAPKEGGCPLLRCAIVMGKTPLEWIDTWDRTGPYPLGDQYHCIEFRGPDGGGREPRPKPDPPGQYELFPRPEPSRRTLKPINVEVRV